MQECRQSTSIFASAACSAAPSVLGATASRRRPGLVRPPASLANIREVSRLRTINDLVVQAAVDLGLEDGSKLRVDTTVVETDIHHPTDNTLLLDVVRVITRSVCYFPARSTAGRADGGALLQIGRNHHTTSKHAPIMARPSVAPSTAALKPARTLVRICGTPGGLIQKRDRLTHAVCDTAQEKSVLLCSTLSFGRVSRMRSGYRRPKAARAPRERTRRQTSTNSRPTPCPLAATRPTPRARGGSQCRQCLRNRSATTSDFGRELRNLRSSDHRAPQSRLRGRILRR